MEDTVLKFMNISASFFGVHALKDVNLSLKKGGILGLVGENGAGKSTLMNILGGVIQPDSGSMNLLGRPYAPADPSAAIRAGIAFIHQELNLFPNLSIADNVFIQEFPRRGRTPFINIRDISRQTTRVLQEVDLHYPPETLVERLSPGERQLVEIARALRAGAHIVIFDEPTTSLTAKETVRLFDIIRRLQAEGRSIIYISHILNDVLRLADQIAVLKDGRLMANGPKDEFTVDRMISLMVGRQLGQLFPPRTGSPGDAVVLEIKGLDQPGLIKDIHLELKAGEILGLFGLMGSGRSELAQIIFGMDSYEKGELGLCGQTLYKNNPRQSIRRRLAFVTENRRDEGLMMDASIHDNMALVSLPAFTKRHLIDKTRLAEKIRQVSDSLKIKSGSMASMPVQNLSGGNQQKVVIAKWLLSEPAVFIMDEPTRGIDVGAKYEIYSLMNDLASRNTGILFISSEIEELVGVCDRIMVMGNGMIQKVFQKAEFDKEQILRAAFQRVE
jgi:ribose transport system ATP-binding protein